MESNQVRRVCQTRGVGRVWHGRGRGYCRFWGQ